MPIANVSYQLGTCRNFHPASLCTCPTYKEYEKAWNAFRFAVTAKKQGHDVKFFLMGEAVECEGLTHDKFNVDEQLKKFVEVGGEILACGTCLKSRQLDSTEACPISNMIDCVNVVIWADKTVTF